MKPSILCLLILAVFRLTGQSYTSFKWNSDEVTFSTVQMTAYYTGPTKSKTIIFTGYKDASVTITQNSPDNPGSATLSAKLSGYFEIQNAVVSEFEYKVKDYQSSVTYNASSGTDLLFVTIYFDEITGKASRIFAASTKNFIDKKSKTLFFNLSGFE